MAAHRAGTPHGCGGQPNRRGTHRRLQRRRRTLVEDFRRLRRRRLVILGDAGAGKTTLAVQILLQLLADRAQRPEDPVPILLPLSGWRPNAFDGNLRDWIVDRIIAGYPDLEAAGHGEQVVDALVAHGHILPILDGLDEAPPKVRESFMRAVHESFGADTPLILTSRTDEFGTAVRIGGRVLSSAVVLEPEPLTAQAAAEYLERCLGPTPQSSWREILQRLRDPAVPAGTLSEIASTPLGLWLIRATYISRAADPSALVDDERFRNGAALRDYLFDQLVAASIMARPPSSDPRQLFRPRHQYEPGRAEGWLRLLAQNLARWQTREFDWATGTPKLTAPFRWSVPIAEFLRQAIPVLDRLIDRYMASRPATRIVVPLGVLAMVCCGGH